MEYYLCAKFCNRLSSSYCCLCSAYLAFSSNVR